MSFTEVRKADMGGKQYVIKLQASNEDEPIWIAASGTESLNKWIKGFKNVKKSFDDQNKHQKESSPMKNEEQNNFFDIQQLQALDG